MAETRPMSQRERNRLHTRNAIVQAAQLLMMRDGANATSVVEVAQLAGVSDTTVFNYFKTKADLMDAVVEEAGSVLRFATLLTATSSGDGPFAALRRLAAADDDQAGFDAAHVVRFLAAVRSDTALWGAYLRVAHDSGDLLADAFSACAPDWSHVQARTAAHATIGALYALLFEVNEEWTHADLAERVDELLARLERAWPA